MANSKAVVKQPKSRFYRVVTGLAVLVVATAAIHYATRETGTFDAARWQDDRWGSGARLAMADRLIASNELMGKSKDDVVKMLGEPSKSGYSSSYDLVYHLGPERGFISIDSECLAIRFGPDGRVSEYRIERD